MGSVIGANPDTNLLEDREATRQRMEDAGFTFVRVQGDEEQMVFRSQNGTEIILSQNSIDNGGGGLSGNFKSDEPPDSPANLRASIDLSSAAKAAFGESGSYISVPSQRELAIAQYADKLTGCVSLNTEHAELDQATKDKMDKIWEEMHHHDRPVPAAPAPIAAPSPAGP